jgi:hypothetical protein
MADLSDSEVFDSIISGGTAEPGDKQEPTPQPRDEAGKFASPQPEPPVQAQAPVAEPQAPTPETPPAGGVPVGAVKAEREKRQAAEADAEALRREIAELRGMVQAVRQPAPQPQQEKQPVSIFEDPDAFLQSQLSPVQQQLQEMREEVWESRAAVVHTQEAVDAAKEAANALAGTPQGRALHQQITAGGNPFDNLVKWHKQQQAYARVGNDPDAWLNAEIEKRMQDPAFLAQAVERARAGVSPTPQTRQPVTSIPPSLSRLPAGGNAPQGGEAQSDDALFSATTSGRRGKR